MSSECLVMSLSTGRHQAVLSHPFTLHGKVVKVGYYRDTLPLLVINIKKEDAETLPFKVGERVPIPFVVNGQRYMAGLRATARSANVMICSDLIDGGSNAVRLVDVLYSAGWTQRNSNLTLSVEGNSIYWL